MRLTTPALGLLLALSASPVVATPLTPFIDLQERGLTLTGDAAGGDFSSFPDLTVTIGGSVRFGLLYWSGAHACPAPCGFAQPYADQEVVFGGTPVTGTVIGTDAVGDTLNLGYLADVTSRVAALGSGTHSFSISDGNTSSNLDTLDGFGLLVAFTDPRDRAFTRVQVWDGLDFLTAGDAATITFLHGSTEFGRTGEVFLMGGNGTSSPSDYLAVGGGATIGNPFTGSAGARFDLYRREFEISSGVGSTTLAVGIGRCAAGAESIRWQVGALVTRDGEGSAAGGPAEGPSCANVPEPTTLSLLGAVAVLSVRRLRKRHLA